MVCRHSHSGKVLYRKTDGIVIGLLNVQSAVRKALIIKDLIVEKSLDILVLTETWLHECGDEPAIKEMTPDGFVFFHSPRSSGQRGGGLAVIHRASIMVKICKEVACVSFECMSFLITQNKLTVRTVALYRPPPSAVNNLKDSMFHEEFGKMIATNTNKNILILGDFNFQWDEPTNVHTRRITQLFDSADLVQHIVNPTHSDGHILDWIVTRSDKQTIVHSVSVEDILLSDHFLVRFTTNMFKPDAKKREIHARN